MNKLVRNLVGIFLLLAASVAMVHSQSLTPKTSRALVVDENESTV